MEVVSATDAELLADWVKHRREPAFRALVSRYAVLVHMAARRTCGDDSLAADASQLTFILLAQKAKSLTNHTSLAGWLHVTAVRKTRDLIDKSRREHRKRQRLAMEIHTTPQGESWREIQPVLDESLAALSAKDREALLLRFYRALSVREVAEILGIATDAAQKRIDRATGRLRAKLLRHGCKAGGSLSATMLAGFTADAQAAVPAVSLLASKAIAAGAAGTGVFSTTTAFLFATAMKTTSVAVPLVALFATGIWIASQRHSIAKLDRQSALLETSLAAETRDQNPSSRVRTTKVIGPIDWKDVAARMREARTNDEISFHKLKAAWNLRLSSMSREELISALDEIAALELPNEYRNLLEQMLVEPVMLKDPELVLSRFGDRLQDDQSWIFWQLTIAISEWAKGEPARASAWLDERVADGGLDAKSLDGTNPARLKLEAGLIGSLLATDPVGATSRLSALTEGQSVDVLKNLSRQPLSEDVQLAFASLVRQHAPDDMQARLISERTISLPTNHYLSEVIAYLERIRATPAERAACVERAVSFGLHGRRQGIFSEDLEKLRALASEIPDETRRRTILDKLK